MATGEGKTLVATLPLYLNALPGRGVHLVTVNDYLAQRDAEWMGKIFEFLGLSVGKILQSMQPWDRKKEYACDITYGTNNEFGFDYLRDNMVTDAEDMVQREHYLCHRRRSRLGPDRRSPYATYYLRAGSKAPTINLTMTEADGRAVGQRAEEPCCEDRLGSRRAAKVFGREEERGSRYSACPCPSRYVEK